MENLVDKALKEMISNALLELEDIANSDEDKYVREVAEKRSILLKK